MPRLSHYFLPRLLFAKKQILYLDGANQISPLLLARFASGLTTRELMDRGGGMRPPNRIHDLREEGHAIKTIHEGRGVYRYVLCKFLSQDQEKATAPKELQRAPVKTDNRGRPLADDLKSMPLFASVTRR